jgi:hypothetical protein
MRKLTPEQRERIRALDRQAKAYTAQAQEILDRAAANMQARKEWHERRRQRLRRLTFGLLGR